MGSTLNFKRTYAKEGKISVGNDEKISSNNIILP
jgi:hypothetical protein